MMILNDVVIFFLFTNAGSFENPLCCPCYLCACCGGLGQLLLFVIAGNGADICCQLVWNVLDADYVRLDWRLLESA